MSVGETQPQHLTLADYSSKPVFKKNEVIDHRTYRKSINILLPILSHDNGLGLTIIETAIQVCDNSFDLDYALQRMYFSTKKSEDPRNQETTLTEKPGFAFSSFDIDYVLKDLFFSITNKVEDTPLKKLSVNGFDTLEEFEKLLTWYTGTLVYEISQTAFQLSDRS